MRIGRKGWITIGSIAALLTAAAVYLSYASFDVTSFKGALSERIVELSGIRVEFERARVRLLPRPRFTIEGLTLAHRGKEFLKAGTTTSTVNLMPLLSGKINSDPLVMDDAVLTLVREEDGTLNIEKIVPSGRFTFKSARINNARVHFTDIAVKERSGTAFEKTISNISAQADFSSGWYEYRVIASPEDAEELTLSGRVRKSGGKFEAEGSVGVAGVSLDAFAPYLRAKTKTITLKGSADIVATYRIGDKSTGSGTITYSDIAIGHARAFDSPVRSKKGAVSFDVAVDPGKVELKSGKARLFMEGFEADLLARAKFLDDGDSTIELDASTTPAPISSVKALIPTRLLPPSVNSALNGLSELSGTIEIERLKLSGPIDSISDKKILDLPGAIEAIVLIRGAGGRVNTPRARLSSVSAQVRLKDGVLSVEDLRGNYDGGVINDLDGRLYRLTKDGAYDVSMKASLDADKTLAIAKELFKENLPARLKSAKVKGRVDLSLKLNGSIKQKKPADYKGELALDDFGLKHDELPLELKSANGRMKFDRRELFFTWLTLKDEQSTLKLDGKVIDWSTGNPNVDLLLHAKAHEKTLRAILRRLFPDEARIEGPIEATAEVKGSKDDLSLALDCDLTAATLDFKPLFIRKEAWFPARLSATARIGADKFTLDASRLNFGSSEISAKGTVHRNSTEYDAHVASKGVKITDIEGMTSQVSKLSGTMAARGEVSFDIKAKKARDNERSIEGAFKITDALFISPYFAYPMELDASAEFSGNEASLSLGKLKTGESIITGNAKVKDITKRVVEFDIHSPKARMEDLRPVPQGDLNGNAGKWSDPLAGIIGSGTIKADELLVGPAVIRDFKADIKLSEKEVVASPITFVKNNGTISGNFTLFRTADDPRLFKTSFRARGVNIEKFIGEFTPEKNFLTGRLSGKVELEGKKGAEPLQSGINGTARLGAQGGKLWKFVLLSKIFSIVNILSIDELFKDGLSYEHIRGSYTIEDGVIATDNMFLSGDSLRMSAIGEIDTATWSIDAMLGMHPFVTIDKIISNIPLLGWIIGGKERSTISMYYGIDGPISDPVIEPVPAKSLIKGVDILQRLLETPIRLLVPDEED